MLVQIDTTQPHKYYGKICVSGKRDTLLGNSGGIVCFEIFDGITGKKADKGVVWFDGIDTLKFMDIKMGHLFLKKQRGSQKEVYETNF